MNVYDEAYEADALPVRPKDIQGILDLWAHSMRLAKGDAQRLQVITTVSRMLARFGDSAIEPRDYMTEVSYNSYELGAEEVQSALNEGIRSAETRAAKGAVGPPIGAKRKEEPEPPLISLNEIDAGDDPGPIPPRGWLLANQFCCRFLSSIVATGGTGKSALRLLQYLALATLRELTEEHVFRRSRVLLLSFEDDIEELNRRLAAALIHHRIDRDEIRGWLFIAAPKGLKLAEMHGGSRQIGQLERTLRDAIKRRKPDVIGLDPFVKLHALEENDNGQMDFVCDLLTQLAIEHNIAVDAPHHQNKGTPTPGDADSGRGGSSIRDAGRLVFTLTPMSEQEAKTFSAFNARRHHGRQVHAHVPAPSPKST
jgi:hypothetical protein